MRTYTKLVKELILEYVNWVARKTGSLAYDVSIRKGRNLKLGIPKLPKVTYDLPLELKNILDDSIPVHSMRLLILFIFNYMKCLMVRVNFYVFSLMH